MGGRKGARAPGMKIGAGSAKVMKAVRRRYEPREAIDLLRAGRWWHSGPSRRWQLGGVVLRRALGHHAVFLDMEGAVGLEPPLQHHLRVDLEGVRQAPGVAGAHDLA